MSSKCLRPTTRCRITMYNKTFVKAASLLLFPLRTPVRSRFRMPKCLCHERNSGSEDLDLDRCARDRKAELGVDCTLRLCRGTALLESTTSFGCRPVESSDGMNLLQKVHPIEPHRIPVGMVQPLIFYYIATHAMLKHLRVNVPARLRRCEPCFVR